MKFFIFMIVIFISGCQTNLKNKHSYEVSNNQQNKILSQGIGTQFPYKQKYSLTAAHVVDKEKQILSKHDKCDVALIYKSYKASNDDPIFAESKINEKVVAYGFPHGNKKEVELSGKIIGYKNVTNGDYTKGCAVAIMDFNVENGMSGGPVYNNKNQIVGIIFATDKYKRQSYMVPYESIKDWLNKNRI